MAVRHQVYRRLECIALSVNRDIQLFDRQQNIPDSLFRFSRNNRRWFSFEFERVESGADFSPAFVPGRVKGDAADEEANTVFEKKVIEFVFDPAVLATFVFGFKRTTGEINELIILESTAAYLHLGGEILEILVAVGGADSDNRLDRIHLFLVDSLDIFFGGTEGGDFICRGAIQPVGWRQKTERRF